CLQSAPSWQNGIVHLCWEMEMIKKHSNIPDGEDNPNIDTVYDCYQKKRNDLDTFSEKELKKFEIYDDPDFAGTNDIIQPCGYTQRVLEHFHMKYAGRNDVADLIEMLDIYPVFGSKIISDELIRLLKKVRIKPVSDEASETWSLHQETLYLFSEINPKRGEVEAAYVEIVERLNKADRDRPITIENVKTIIKRAKKNKQKVSQQYLEFQRGVRAGHEAALRQLKGSSSANG
ncbi:hypothetical protein N9C56_15390, partial [Paracoccaceae bacterium]|nr:hypothetical protein [Paracoccaceae bacterium]